MHTHTSIELAALIEIVRLIDRPNFTGPGVTPEIVRLSKSAGLVPAQLLGPIETVDSDPIARKPSVALEMVRALQP